MADYLVVARHGSALWPVEGKGLGIHVSSIEAVVEQLVVIELAFVGADVRASH